MRKAAIQLLNRKIETVLKAADFTETYIGMWNSPLYDCVVDLNSGGVAVETLEGDLLEYKEEEYPLLQRFFFLRDILASTKYRADLPF